MFVSLLLLLDMSEDEGTQGLLEAPVAATKKKVGFPVSTTFLKIRYIFIIEEKVIQLFHNRTEAAFT